MKDRSARLQRHAAIQRGFLRFRIRWLMKIAAGFVHDPNHRSVSKMTRPRGGFFLRSFS